MKFDTIHGGRNKKIVIGLVVFVVLAIVIIVPGSRAKYQVTGSIDIVDGEVSWSPYDLYIKELYVDDGSGSYTLTDIVPSGYYEVNTTKSYCEVDGVADSNVTITYEDGVIYVNFSQKNTDCYVYFDISYCPEGATACEYIMANMDNVATRDDFSVAVTQETTGTIYSVEDGMYGGTSYYFAGAPTDNYVYFADYWWRIVRINGDGSIRLIYLGESYDSTGEDSEIGTSAYNTSYDAAEYVGFTYESGLQRPTSQNGGTDSTIKTYLDDWYSDYLSDYSSYLDISGKFCNDRTSYSDQLGTTPGWSSSSTDYYAVMAKVSSGNNPSLDCSEENDIYTISIGLITYDEIAFAGFSRSATNTSYYLHSGSDYWTMSPIFYGGTASVFVLPLNGGVGVYGVQGSYGVRPVINLSPSVTLTGSGTNSDPYALPGHLPTIVYERVTFD